MGTFAKDAFSVARDRILDEYAEKRNQVLRQVRLTRNRGGYVPALTKCAGECLREEILALADAWVEEFTLRGIPCIAKADKDLDLTAREMAAGSNSALRGQLDLMSRRTGIPLNHSFGYINRELGKFMSSALKEGRLRIKRQRLVAQTSIHRTQKGGPSINPAQAKKHDSVSSFSLSTHSTPKEALHNTELRRAQLPLLPGSSHTVGQGGISARTGVRAWPMEIYDGGCSQTRRLPSERQIRTRKRTGLAPGQREVPFGVGHRSAIRCVCRTMLECGSP
jgi:hypothetical protein